MKTRILGFEWHLGRGIALDEFLKHLQNLSGIEIQDPEKPGIEAPTRMLALTLKDGYWVGLLLTIKNMRAFVQMKKEGTNFKITPTALEQGNNIVDFNFFLIHPSTGKGLYQYYHQSAAANTFCFFCKRQYDQLNQYKIESEISSNGGDSLSESELKKIRRKFKGSLRYSTIVRQESFLKIINELAEISSFNFEFATFQVDEPRYKPLEDYIKRIIHQVNFVKLRKDQIVSGIKDIFLTNVLKYGKVKGVDPQGNDVVYKLINNFDEFANYDYHEIVHTVNIDSDNLINSISNSFIINELIKIAKLSKINAILSTKSK